MPTAIIGRIRCNADGLPVSEYLHREEALFVETEWIWVTGKDQATIFPSLESAEEAKRQQKEHVGKDECSIFVIVCGLTPAARAARDRREEERITTALASEQRAPSAPCGVPPSAMAKADHHGRRRAARQNREVAVGRKSAREAAQQQRPETNEARAWKKVFERMEARHPHEDVFEETERRCGS